ncbi:unnamed protein product [Orchesella dallaii]|uniref:Peptidase S8/S53 domain-containing protein n=1 Tax=Orchesella dallaii TaxID=48710 RepID=A0ABP1PW81_9HEXA
MKFFIPLLLCVLGALAAPELKLSDKFTPELKSVFRSNPASTNNVFVHFEGGTATILESIIATGFPNREERLNTMHTLLVANAETSQRNALSILSDSELYHHSFWINNQLYIRDVDLATILEISRLEEVSGIYLEETAHLIEPVENKNATLSADFEWGIVKIQAPEAWEVIGQKNGEGVRVATIDTGVRVSHEALRNNFLGEYGWFDPSTAEPLPTDRNGHGTHTTGTIAGSNGIGVAPGAKWMACRGCATSACSQSDLTMCGQFVACPTLADGSNPDCSKAPHVVSNSWGGGRGTTWFNPVIDAWVAAGLIPVFSIGNSGPRCNTANSPGDNAKVIGVGSTMESDAISFFSSIGPTTDLRMKPDISAPGSEVNSAYHTADNAYRVLSGTSMAAPHVSGVVALLLTRDSDLTAANVRDLLVRNTDKALVFSGLVCEDVPDSEFPNHVFGSGRLNALKSVQAQTKMLKN